MNYCKLTYCQMVYKCIRCKVCFTLGVANVANRKCRATRFKWNLIASEMNSEQAQIKAQNNIQISK